MFGFETSRETAQIQGDSALPYSCCCQRACRERRDPRLSVRARRKSLPVTTLGMWRRMLHRYAWAGNIAHGQ
jgi:hypothetical protein